MQHRARPARNSNQGEQLAQTGRLHHLQPRQAPTPCYKPLCRGVGFLGWALAVPKPQIPEPWAGPDAALSYASSREQPTAPTCWAMSPRGGGVVISLPRQRTENIYIEGIKSWRSLKACNNNNLCPAKAARAAGLGSAPPPLVGRVLPSPDPLPLCPGVRSQTARCQQRWHLAPAIWHLAGEAERARVFVSNRCPETRKQS